MLVTVLIMHYILSRECYKYVFFIVDRGANMCFAFPPKTRYSTAILLYLKVLVEVLLSYGITHSILGFLHYVTGDRMGYETHFANPDIPLPIQDRYMQSLYDQIIHDLMTMEEEEKRRSPPR